MRTELTIELDELLATYLRHFPKECIRSSEKFPHVIKILEAVKDIVIDAEFNLSQVPFNLLQAEVSRRQLESSQ